MVCEFESFFKRSTSSEDVRKTACSPCKSDVSVISCYLVAFYMYDQISARFISNLRWCKHRHNVRPDSALGSFANTSINIRVTYVFLHSKVTPSVKPLFRIL